MSEDFIQEPPGSKVVKDDTPKAASAVENTAMLAEATEPIQEYPEKAETAAGDPPDPLPDSAADMQAQLDAVRDHLNKRSAELLNGIAGLRDLLQDRIDKDQLLAQKEKNFTEVYNDMKKYRTGAVRDIMEPWVKCMIEFFEHIRSSAKVYRTKVPAFGSPSGVYEGLLKEFENLGEHILILLDRLGIERIDPEPGTRFDRKQQKCMESIPCADPALDDTIRECFRVGFRYVDSGKVIHCAEVSVRKWNKENNHHDEQ